MKFIRAMNRYFFDEDHISISDALWYYGTMVFMIVSVILVIFL